jgi:hypothetical protein
MDDAISIFEEAHPGCVALFIFDQSSAHASLGADALCAFDMNKENGGSQCIQKDTIFPDNCPNRSVCGQIQRMTMDGGVAKGLQQTLQERGFNVKGMRAKCSPICPIENDQCCMACLLSQQLDFCDQVSLLKQKIAIHGHLCLFLPKFHCKLNPIEMMSLLYLSHTHILMLC